jgi:hypothetical protein
MLNVVMSGNMLSNANLNVVLLSATILKVFMSSVMLSDFKLNVFLLRNIGM